MHDLASILTAHAKRYPLMRPQDAVKLLYQNEFGGGHLITDVNACLTRLHNEFSSVAFDPTAPLVEDIGGNMVRVMLAALSPEEYPLETLNDDFVRSAELHTGNLDHFLQKLNVLKDLTAQGLFPFSSVELDAYLADYVTSGCPAVSHSQAYRDAYHPIYRVLHRSCLSVAATVQHAIRQCRTPKNRPLLVAIDGRCASGKTTLAANLQKACGYEVIHMDDFFLRPEQRNKERYETPGENIDHERFLIEVLQPLYQGKFVEYCPFDCSTQQLTTPVHIQSTPVILIEGSYSCHPDLWPYYDLRIFLTVSPEQQMDRIVARNGVEYAEVFRKKWIPLEEAYFSAYELASKCDLCFEI